MTDPKDPNEAKVVSVREFVDTSKDPVTVAGKTVKTAKVAETIAKQHETAMKQAGKSANVRK